MTQHRSMASSQVLSFWSRSLKAGHFIGVEPKPRHRGVDMKRGGKPSSRVRAPITPHIELQQGC